MELPSPKWLVIAKNEYRVRTSSIRVIRAYFPYLTVGLLAAYVTFIAPALVSLFFDEFHAFILSQAALAMVQVMLFMIFFYFIVFPITNTFKEAQTSQVEVFLSTPTKPSDVLLGEFVGAMPFYGIAVTVIAGLFTAALNPLGLDMFQIAATVPILALTFFSALWIGTVTAALLRNRLGRTGRGTDIGKALAFVIALPMVALMYALMGGGLLKALVDPETGGLLRAALGLLPSSWGAEVIIGFAQNPGNISAVGLGTLTRFGGLVAFFLTALLLGKKAANRAYSLEPTAFTASRAKPDGAFYSTVKRLGGGGSFGALLVSVFKDYGRRLQNLSKIAYIMGLLVIVNIFVIDPGDVNDVLLFSQLFLAVFALFVVGEVTLRGKECLFIYRMTPSGVGRLVKARLLQGWILAVPFAAAVMAISMTRIPQITFISLLTGTGIVTLTTAANVAFALGLSLLNPAFSDKSGSFMANVFIVPNVSLALTIAANEFLAYPHSIPPLQSLLYFTTPMSWLVGIVTLYLGKRKLDALE